MNLKELYEQIPFKWRVQSFSKFKLQGQCVAYIDARDAQKKLDDVCGQENWQAIYYEVGSMLFCKVGIRIGDEWVWKSDTGSESNIEKEKGHSSDAFKRACVLWGIGRFLYDMKIKYVTANEKKTKTNFPHVVDNNGNRVWDLTEHINKSSYQKKPKPNVYTNIQDSPFLKEMKGYAEQEADTYWSVLGQNGYEKATDIPVNKQDAILKEMSTTLKAS